MKVLRSTEIGQWLASALPAQEAREPLRFGIRRYDRKGSKGGWFRTPTVRLLRKGVGPSQSWVDRDYITEMPLEERSQVMLPLLIELFMGTAPDSLRDMRILCFDWCAVLRSLAGDKATTDGVLAGLPLEILELCGSGMRMVLRIVGNDSMTREYLPLVKSLTAGMDRELAARTNHPAACDLTPAPRPAAARRARADSPAGNA